MKTLEAFGTRGSFPRRTFLKRAATLSTIAGAPWLVPSSVLGANAPGNRITVGFIGCGNQSTIDLPAFLGHDDCQVLAVCDVNTASFGYKTPDQFLGRKPAQERVNAFYASHKASGSYKGCDACNDFREVLARTDIDAVAIVVPDHWHAPMVAMAARAGKDVYCEKPLSLTVSDGQAMVKAVRQHRRILQTGSHYRSSPDYRRACQLVRNGRIGQVKRILTQVAEINAVDPGPGWQPMPVPDGFDYELWLGPAPWAPYHKDRCLYRFRFNLDYSGGQVTNFGAHSNDAAQWALDMDGSGPVEFEDLGSEWPPAGGLYNTATKTAFRARYANGVELVCQTAKPGFGIRFEGSDGWVEYGYQGLKTHPESLKTSTFGPNDILLPVSNPNRTVDAGKYHIPDHVRNFLDSVKSRRDPIEPVEVGHRSASVCHLGNIVMRLKRKLRWDPAREQFVDDAEANRMLARPIRLPWRL
ncbi:MAG TPA: Gfo/Idh/MocA family oxidoreductase [Verrucomicrobiota bacterium]|nr:Gfo/Idh/MocA family oxidoreductase [Verrucomicrobiota bacterium]HNU52264.1 Gfo/Idh/MocA family oxidoreductase [Verrucomicrobiota bacterium]